MHGQKNIKSPIHSFTGDRKKNYTNHLTDQHPSMLCFYEYLREANFYGHSILTESVFVTQMSSYLRISV